MKLYEIDRQLELLLSAVDEETGELLCTSDALDQLLLTRTEKLEGIALWVKNLRAEAAMIKAEEATLHNRRVALENKSERIAVFLQNYLGGETVKTARVVVSYRRSSSVRIDDAVFWQNAAEAFIRQKPPEVDRTAIKSAIKEGKHIPGASLVENLSMIIK